MVLSLFAMARYLGDQLPQVWTELASARKELVLAAFVLVGISNGVAGLFWRAILGASGVPTTTAAAVASWSASAVAKYGLGAPGQYASRLYIVGTAGAPKRRVALGFGLELAAITGAGVALVLALLPLVGYAIGLPASAGWLGPPSAGAVLVGLPVLLSIAVGRLGSFGASPGHEVVRHLRHAILAAFLNWLLVGGALFLLLVAVDPTDITMLPRVLAVVVIATLSGLYALTPLGLGVREAVMTFMLTPTVPITAATSAALLHRVCTVVADLLWGAVALRLVRRTETDARPD